MFISQPFERRLAQDEYPYSSSLPTMDHGYSLLTSSFHPPPTTSIDDTFLPSSSNPLFMDENEWFAYPNQEENDVNLFPTTTTTSMNNNNTTSPMPSSSSIPPLTSNYSPQSELSSMVSPQLSLDTMQTMIQPSSSSSQQQQQPQEEEKEKDVFHYIMMQQQNNNNNNIHDHQDKMVPTKGHRRRRSSSVPSLFHSIKKHIPMSPVYDTNQDPLYVPPLPQPSAITSSNSTSPYLIYYPHYPHPTHHHHQYDLATTNNNIMVMNKNSNATMKKPLPIKIKRHSPPMKQTTSTPLNQQQLDEKLLRINFNDVTVAELKDYLRERNLSVAGRKAELTNRLYKEKQRIALLQTQKNKENQEEKEPQEKEIKMKHTNIKEQNQHRLYPVVPSQQQQQQQQQQQHSPIASPHIHHLTNQINHLAFQSPSPLQSELPSPTSTAASIDQQQQQQPPPPSQQFIFSFDDHMYPHPSSSSWSNQEDLNMFQYLN
ncbi:hypothetical protein BJ944DRAFT_272791 [Cunninghamella echinulata]|nr:hypothetical protein BJ944DRAFT_272791 [Cunninghamella echinulata]